MLDFDWVWQPSNVNEFGPVRFVHDPVFGKQVHNYASPFWQFDFSLPPSDDDVRREIATFFAETEGVAVANVYDPRVPVPKHYHMFRDLDDAALIAMIPDVTVTAMSSVNRTLTIVGQNDDVITKDDPIAFTHNGIRHYYRSLETKTLTGVAQSLRVDLRPRITTAGLSIVADRVKPTHRFQIAFNDKGGSTDADGFTNYSLRGVEFPWALQ